MSNPEVDNYCKTYDSIGDTYKHKQEVSRLINAVVRILLDKSVKHDESKLENPEKEIFDKYTPLLSNTTYGSETYKNHLQEMGNGLQHHYEYNFHHPEHYVNGIQGMTLIDIMEMIIDWLAATKKHKDGDILKSIEINQKRFGYGDDLKQIFINTIKELELVD